MEEAETVENEPDTLVEMCISYCVNYPDILTEEDPSYSYDDILKREDHKAPPCLRSGLFLPINLCDRLLSYYTTNATSAWNPNALYDDIMNIFKDVERTQLSRAIFRADFGLFSRGIEMLCEHPLRHLEFSCCNYCTHTAETVFLPLKKLASTLKVLKLWQKEGCPHCKHEFISQMLTLAQDSHIIGCKKIQVLAFQNFQFDGQPDIGSFFCSLLNPLVQLTHLDISGCTLNESHLRFLSEVPNLLYLSLSSINITPSNLKTAVEMIIKANKLRHLDLSQADSQPKLYKDPEENMKQLIQSLPSLTSLDISGTNLAENKSMLACTSSHKLEARSGAGDSGETVIQAFKGKMFEFLGLFQCTALPCLYSEVPAKQTTGDKTDEQLIFSLYVYKENGNLFKKVLEAMFQRLQETQGKKFPTKIKAIQGILNGLQCHPNSRDIQRAGCACLFFLMKSKKVYLPLRLQHRVTETLIFTLNQFQDDGYVVKCCLLCFLCLDLPDIAVTCHIFKWYVACVIEALWNFEGDFYERIGLRLLHETCRADYKEKNIVGEQGAISLILQIIERKLDANDCDENMERAWSCLWSLTDEMPLNCRRFLDENGMTHYMNCIRIFNEEAGLLRKLTGLMANLSEVSYLRPELMTEELMSIFRGFLDSQLDDKSVSYHAASIMSEFAADGDAAWTVESPTREEIQEQIIETVKSWDIDEAKKIKYRSLNPMLRLVQDYDTPAAQYWAIWALCNLCKVKEESYCPMLEMEGGVQILETILKDSRPSPEVHQLTDTTLNIYYKYKQKRNLAPDI